MRFKEFNIVKEFSQQAAPAPVNDPANDLAYLITNTELSPQLKKLLGRSLKNIATAPQVQPIQPVAPVTTATQVQAKNTPPVSKPAPVTQKINQPMGQEPIQQSNVTENIDAEEAELLNYIKNVKNKAELGKLLYVVRDEQFKEMASTIVKNKIKFKPKETYELIKTRIRALNTRVPVSIMTDFLNACLEGGVINAQQMISDDTTKGVRIPLLDPKYQKIAEAFLDLNLERLGKGEIGLAFMGIDAIKETSDVSISGKAIEVKASRGKSDFFMKGNPDEGGFGHQSEAVKILANALNKAGGTFKPINRSKQGGIAVVGRTNIDVFNQYFSALGPKETYKVITQVLKELNKKMPNIVNTYSDDIKQSINPDGTVDYPLLSLATAKINFDYYKAMSHHEGVLVLNLNSFQYVYVNNADAWADYVGRNIIQQKYAIDFRSNGLGGISYVMNKI